MNEWLVCHFSATSSCISNTSSLLKEGSAPSLRYFVLLANFCDAAVGGGGLGSLHPLPDVLHPEGLFSRAARLNLYLATS